ncbi:flagellar motor switch protein FliN [Lacrimispora sp. 38-1]|uniref:flagellar motor switch protein FliN n=1 Tax=Lacrimispora sp. 38-1 TaxID=3125778 RepID=UPI003CE83480
MDSNNFSAFEIDAIGEILNISLGASATAVSTMLNARVDITTPVVRVLTKSEFEISNLEPAVGVEITYIAGLSGSNIMLLKKHDVKVIVDMLMGTETPEEDFELNELNISAICEVMNQMMGASATALSEFLSKAVNISTPTSFEIEDVGDFKEKYYHDEDLMVVVGFNLKIADQMASEFINVMPPALAKELVAGFFPQAESEPEVETAPAKAPEPVSEPASSGGILSQEEIEKLLAGSSAPEPQPQPQTPPKQESSGGILSQEEIEMLLNGSKATDAAPAPAPTPVPTPAPAAQPVFSMPTMPTQMPDTDNSAMQQMMNQMQMQQQMINQMQQMILQMQNSQMNMPKKEAPEPKTINVKPVPQNNLTDGQVSFEEQEENRELIMGVPLEVSVEIGRTRKLVKEILEFTKGSLVILDKLAGEQVDLYVNGRCIAKGDVVVVDDNFGIRISEIIKRNVE